jgi:hypothetical protein
MTPPILESLTLVKTPISLTHLTGLMCSLVSIIFDVLISQTILTYYMMHLRILVSEK